MKIYKTDIQEEEEGKGTNSRAKKRISIIQNFYNAMNPQEVIIIMYI